MTSACGGGEAGPVREVRLALEEKMKATARFNSLVDVATGSTLLDRAHLLEGLARAYCDATGYSPHRIQMVEERQTPTTTVFYFRPIFSAEVPPKPSWWQRFSLWFGAGL